MVQIAWQLWECHGDFGAGADGMLEKGSIIVDPAGAFAIPEAAARIHGITPERAAAEGVTWESGSVVPAIQRLIGTADLLVAHNTEFDVGVVCSELVRCGRNDLADRFLALPKYCTMKNGTLPRARWPRLRDLYVRLFQREPEGRLHDAQTDVQVCAEIYFALQRLSAAAAGATSVQEN
jgi:DNA polymerase III epsilon subunit-like protein